MTIQLFSSDLNLHGPKNPKYAIKIDSYLYSNSCFPKPRVSLPPPKSQPTNSSFNRNTRFGSLQFSSLHQNFDTRKIPKSAITFVLFRHSKSIFSVTTGFISPTKVAIENFLLLRSISIKNFFSVLYARILIIQNCQNVFLIWSFLDFPTRVPP